MDTYNSLYSLWSTDLFFDESTRSELLAIRGDENEIKERFYQDLAFGTAGLRGLLGAGTNRMNIYTVAKATAGVAAYIKKEGEAAKRRGVAISFDSRHFSEEFARLAAGVLTKEGIRVFLSNELRPVPLLSYAVRHFKAIAGVMITASHNPPAYNGYKLYGEDGGQVAPEVADVVLSFVEDIKDIRTLSWHSYEEAQKSGLLTVFGEDLDESYMAMLKKLVIDPEAISRHKDMPMIYTPIHGSGNKPVRRILAEVGFTNIQVVPEQEQPDGSFPTVKAPNPEDSAALSMAISLAKKEKASLVFGTDPDCDRIGVAVRTEANGEEAYVSLTGNQIGVLLLDYILSSKKDIGQLPSDSFAVTTIVSSRLAKLICDYYGVELFTVLTGFKFIGEKILEYDERGDKHFQFGFEESFGYLSGRDVRDKDAVVAAVLIAGMAAQSIDRGETLLERLENLYKKVGYGVEDTISISLEGIEGLEKISSAMSALRSELEAAFASKERATLIPGLSIQAVQDYMSQRRMSFSENEMTEEKVDLPSSNVLLYEIGGKKGLDWACVRPSGTEPKLKIYFGVYGDDKEEVGTALSEIREKVTSFVKGKL